VREVSRSKTEKGGENKKKRSRFLSTCGPGYGCGQVLLNSNFYDLSVLNKEWGMNEGHPRHLSFLARKANREQIGQSSLGDSDKKRNLES